MEDQLVLDIKIHGRESAEAKKDRAELLRLEADKINKQKDMEQEFLLLKKQANGAYAGLLAEARNFVVDNLDAQSGTYKVFEVAIKAAQIAEVVLNAEARIAANNKYAASDFRNAIPGGSAIVLTEATFKNGLAVARTALSVAKISAFAEGGRTD